MCLCNTHTVRACARMYIAVCLCCIYISIIIIIISDSVDDRDQNPGMV